MKRSTDSARTDGVLAGIRIARVSTVPFFVLSQLKRQIEMLTECGAQVTIVTSNGPELLPLKALPGVACETIEIPRGISPLLDIIAIIKLFLFFRRNQLQIVHSTTPKAGLLTAIAAFMAAVPIRLHTFTGQPWLHLRGPVRWLSRWSDWLIGQLNTRCYADSPSQRDFLVEQMLIPENKLLVLGAGSLAGVDTTRFSKGRFTEKQCISLKQSLGIGERSPVILFVGRIARDKGVSELANAFHRIKREGSPTHLLMVGPEDEDRCSLRQELCDVPDVHWIGYTGRPESYLAIADILCLPSYREGFGTVVIEAGAMGIPTVGTAIYGLSDAVLNNETGILVPPRDSEALGDALIALLNDLERCRQLGNAAKKRAYECFDANIVNTLVIEECSRLLANARSRQ